VADEDHTVPATADLYKPIVHGFPGATVDVADSRYKSAAAAAHKSGMSQHMFSQMLGIEGQRVAGSHAKPAAAAAPVAAPIAASPRKIEGYDKMSMSERLIASGNI
jgi:hypothetical protein